MTHTASVATDDLDLGPQVQEGIDRTQSYLRNLQHDDGHWCGELEGDTILESEYVLTLHFLGRTDEERVRKAANYVRGKQHAGGGWGIYPGGAADVSSSAKAYFVLKLAGDDPEAPHMVSARRVIRDLGGLDACNSFTKIYLAIFGQYDWNDCPSGIFHSTRVPTSIVGEIDGIS